MGFWMTRRPRSLGCRLTLLAALAAAWCALGLAGPAPRAAAAAGAAGAASMPAASLGSPTWAATSTTTGATSSYTFSFTTAPGVLGVLLTSVTMTVPPGTGGTPTLGTVTPAGLLGTGAISLSGTTLTYSGSLTPTLAPGTAISIQVNGLVNTTTPGTYTSQVTTFDLVINTGSGTTNSLTFTGTLNLTVPTSLAWSAALTGATQSVSDGHAADQQLTVDDETLSSAGWHVTVSATTFTTGPRSLPDSGTFVFTSLGSIGSATAPSVTCVTSCTLPGNTTTYPVAITTAASPAPFTVFDAPIHTGLGAVTIGGSAAAHPIGWWVSIPANTRTGSYVSTLTVRLISGP
jgi:hypothetical protein